MSIFEDLGPEARDRVVESIQRRIASRPTSAWSRLWQVEIRLLRGDVEVALRELDELAKSEDNELAGAAFIRIGEVFETKGEIPKALAAYREAGRFQKKPLIALARAGDLLRTQGEYKEAEQLFERALGMIDIETLDSLATIVRPYSDLLTGVGRKAEAVALLDRLLQQYPNQAELTAFRRELVGA